MMLSSILPDASLLTCSPERGMLTESPAPSGLLFFMTIESVFSIYLEKRFVLDCQG